MLVFLKLGGSLITDKRGVEQPRPGTIARLAQEIKTALNQNPTLQLIIGHGSGSFGHVSAAKYGTRKGVSTAIQWQGFSEVSTAALRLNAIMREALHTAGVPVVSFQPAASAICENGQIVTMASEPIERALANGLVPLVHGDVAFDRVQGGTIVSTEEVLSFIAPTLKPSWLLLAGDTDGVYDQNKVTIPAITLENYKSIRSALGGASGTDVTGGMDSKVRAMLDLSGQHSGLNIRIFSGVVAGNVEEVLSRPGTTTLGTHIYAT